MTLSFKRLVENLTKLPGIGKRSAQRIALYIMKMENQKVEELILALKEIKNDLSFCKECYNFASNEFCGICSNPKRSSDTICVVEDQGHILMIEESKAYSGRYFVLGGTLGDSEKEDLVKERIKELLKKLEAKPIKELIIATNPTTEGEATAFYLANELKPLNIKTTRIALGLPFGSDIELSDQITLGKAIEGRKEI